MRQEPGRRATVDDFWAIPEGERFHELLGGELVRKAAPSGERVPPRPAWSALCTRRFSAREVVRAEPFQAIELVAGTLFGDDSPELEPR
jgi:hypothetical protein